MCLSELINQFGLIFLIAPFNVAMAENMMSGYYGVHINFMQSFKTPWSMKEKEIMAIGITFTL